MIRGRHDQAVNQDGGRGGEGVIDGPCLLFARPLRPRLAGGTRPQRPERKALPGTQEARVRNWGEFPKSLRGG